MRIIVRNILAVLAGIAVGSGVNMGLIVLGPSLIPPPAGVDVTNAESFKAAMHLFQPRHFVVPFAAHALGTLVGSATGCLLSATQGKAIAYGIGAVFMLGGIAASLMIPAPLWFVILDLAVAYIPMAWIGLRLGNRLRSALANAQPTR